MSQISSFQIILVHLDGIYFDKSSRNSVYKIFVLQIKSGSFQVNYIYIPLKVLREVGNKLEEVEWRLSKVLSKMGSFLCRVQSLAQNRAKFQ